MTRFLREAVAFLALHWVGAVGCNLLTAALFVAAAILSMGLPWPALGWEAVSPRILPRSGSGELLPGAIPVFGALYFGGRAGLEIFARRRAAATEAAVASPPTG